MRAKAYAWWSRAFFRRDLSCPYFRPCRHSMGESPLLVRAGTLDRFSCPCLRGGSLVPIRLYLSFLPRPNWLCRSVSYLSTMDSHVKFFTFVGCVRNSFDLRPFYHVPWLFHTDRQQGCTAMIKECAMHVVCTASFTSHCGCSIWYFIVVCEVFLCFDVRRILFCVE